MADWRSDGWLASDSLPDRSSADSRSLWRSRICHWAGDGDLPRPRLYRGPCEGHPARPLALRVANGVRVHLLRGGVRAVRGADGVVGGPPRHTAGPDADRRVVVG